MNRWRKRAGDLRRLASRTHHRMTQEGLLRMAEIHEHLADEAERRWQQQREDETRRSDQSPDSTRELQA